MKNLTDYNDQYLSLEVFNDVYYYAERGNREFLLALVDEEFIYTDEQMRVLMLDLDADEQEHFDYELDKLINTINNGE